MARARIPQELEASAPESLRCGTTAPQRAWIGSAPARALRLVLAALAISGAAGCAAESADDAGNEPVLAKVDTGSSDPTIYGGERDDDEGSIGGVVALRVGAGGSFELCTGALVAPNVVLTARHCVTKNTTTSVSCDENGRSANGPHVVGDEAPGTIGIYTGASPVFSKRPLALAKAIVSPQGDYLCDADIALVVLDRSLSVEPLAVRLEAKAQVGETIRAVGYGQNDMNAPIGSRFRKNALRVLGQGKGLSPSKTPLGEHEFEVGKSICQGDSGGPAISEKTGAVIGVVSRGGKCDEDFGHIYTTTAGFEAMFTQAFAIAGGEPRLESEAQLQSVRTSITTASLDAEEESPQAGSCSVAQPGRGQTTTGLVGLGLVGALIAARRRRAA